MSSMSIDGTAKSSTTSSGSNRSKINHYKTVNNRSVVDESLFGKPNRDVIREERALNTNSSNVTVNVSGPAAQVASAGRRHVPYKKEVVSVISKDNIRTLLVPRDEPSEKTVTLSTYELNEIRRKAKVPTKEEEMEQRRNDLCHQERLAEEAAQRKRMMKQFDLQRRTNEKLNDLEEENYRKAQISLERAEQMRREQDDEIKKLNELILNAKIQAIRDAQVEEKKILARELHDEEKRLDFIMELDRQNAIKLQEAIDSKRREQELIGAQEVLKQIQNNEQERLLTLEFKEIENKNQAKEIAKNMEMEYEKKEIQKKMKALMCQELNQANSEILQRKVLAKEQEKLIDLQVLDYQTKKAEREAAFERESEKIKAEKEKEIARLRGQQERARDEQAQRDAVKAKRAQEENEREWRRKELAEIQKREQINKEMEQARRAQATQKQLDLARQANFDRMEFMRVLNAQKEVIEKERQKAERERVDRERYRKQLHEQIRAQEETKIAERQGFFEEGKRVAHEAAIRQQRLKETRLRKLEELRDCGIPDKYVKLVENKALQAAHE